MKLVALLTPLLMFSCDNMLTSPSYSWQPPPVREHLLVCQGIRSAFTGNEIRYVNCMEGFGYNKVEVVK